MHNQLNDNHVEDYENIATAKGFDLFFDEISEVDLKNIALDLGGNSSFNYETKQVTYMFSKVRHIKLDKLSECHKIVDAVGNRYSDMFDCIFVAGEIYLTVSEKQFELLKDGCQK